MKPKKTTKKVKPKGRSTRPIATATTTVVGGTKLAPPTTTLRRSTAPTPNAPPVPAGGKPMTRERLLSPAAKRGAELVRYVRIHQKRPYGERGMRAIEKLAREVGHLGLTELA